MINYDNRNNKYSSVIQILRDTGTEFCCILKLPEFHDFNTVYSTIVHRCGASGSMRACHVSGPVSVPGRDRFPG